MLPENQWGCAGMQNPKLVTAIGKLAIAGEQAGLSIEHMIQLLNDGLKVETLVDLITWRLADVPNPVTPPSRSAPWIA
jgi:hypothetical protein